MDLFKLMLDHDLEQIVAVSDPATGLRGFIVIHDTTRGPAIGGCRLAKYPSADAALVDGVALAIAMTRKCALAGLNAGGGKGVFIAHDGITDRPAMFRALGRFVDSLNGRFYTSGDLGVATADIRAMRETSRFVAVPDPAKLDLAGAVAAGVLAGMRSALAACGLGRSVAGRTVALQGLGEMGGAVATQLAAQGAHLVIADLDAERVKAVCEATGASAVEPDAIYDAEADLFCPCATSGILTAETVSRLRVKAVVGAANNQLGDAVAGRMLVERGIRYAPDYAVNSGAVILGAKAYLEILSDWRDTVTQTVSEIEETVTRIFEEADATGETPAQVADRLADEALVRPRSTEQQWWPIC